jgi:hypothetical protein
MDIKDGNIHCLNYGGGTQTVAMVVLVVNGVLPRPDHVIIADTSREVSSTWQYLDEHIQPLIGRELDMQVEVAPHSLAKVDLYSNNGGILVPAFTPTGKLRAWCSGEWKARVVARYLRSIHPKGAFSNWIGFSLDEQRRIKSNGEGRIYPLIALAITRSDCERIIVGAGLPLPDKSRCWCCPNQHNQEWRGLSPEEMQKAIALDNEIRETDLGRGEGGLFLHHSATPLGEADLDVPDRKIPPGCQSGLCFL